ncbi:MAG TPA: GGDEF domain-containing protein [Gaiellaceae bacterium]|jgi:diguanylate cyclase (GGDEF)-like protein
MSAASVNTRRLVLLLASACYAGVFAAFVVWDNAALGIGHLFVLPICLVALVSDAFIGLLAGVLATGLYIVAVLMAPNVPSSQAVTGASLIRLVAYVAVGTLIGFFANRNRQLVERLRSLAGLDFITGVGNARSFDEELARRCAGGRPFSLILADLDSLTQINNTHGHAAGNAALKRVGEVLVQHADPGDCVARIGGDEFALVTALPVDQVTTLMSRANRALAPEDLSLTFGATSSPDDGQTAAELFHKADDRLFAAKLVRQNRATVVPLADRTG